ncbi:hypothetical protein [Kineosporia sp. A_224]|uniref:hypothetical protein n=1 Tax=Kineosporia sp. A_224 TaxID=1962180 RepID=UPI001179D732|nr:hypothetical protein [Kineosporia sp. A_224]
MTTRAGVSVSAPAHEAGDLPDGVLPVAGRDLTLLVSVVGCAAASEAAWNVGSATLNLLHLPLPLAIGFPLVLEAAAISCAVQDLRDRRQGIRSRALAAGTYLGLAVSAAVNAAVGWAGHGVAGLLEVLPPVVLAGLIHVHGNRAVRAWQSRAVLRPAWQAEQLRQAQVDSAAEVLPLLAGTDKHGQATTDLLRRRLDSRTLTPAGALLAAGWHARHQRGLTDAELRRLEIVAATVWPTGVPTDLPAVLPAGAGTPIRARPGTSAPAVRRAPAARAGALTSTAPGSAGPVPAPAQPGTRRPASSGTQNPAAGDAAALAAAAQGAAALAAGAPVLGEVRRSASDDELAALVAQALTGNPRAGEGTVRALLDQTPLTAHSRRIRGALAAARTASPTGAVAGAGVSGGTDV